MDLCMETDIHPSILFSPAPSPPPPPFHFKGTSPLLLIPPLLYLRAKEYAVIMIILWVLMLLYYLWLFGNLVEGLHHSIHLLFI